MRRFWWGLIVSLLAVWSSFFAPLLARPTPGVIAVSHSEPVPAQQTKQHSSPAQSTVPISPTPLPRPLGLIDDGLGAMHIRTPPPPPVPYPQAPIQPSSPTAAPAPPRRELQPIPESNLQPPTPPREIQTYSARPEPSQLVPNPQQAARTTSGLSVEVVGPSEILAGRSIVAEILLRNSGPPLVGVCVELPLATELKVLSCVPAIDPERGLRWNLGSLDTNAQQKILVEIQSGTIGEVLINPRVSYGLATGLRCATRPPFSLVVRAPETANVGETVSFNIQLSNYTQEPLRRIKLSCSLSSGLSHDCGSVIETDLAVELQPGQVYTLPLDARVTSAGPQTAQLSAVAENGSSVTGVGSVLVREAGNGP